MKTSRIEALADGIFAFAMTLLVLGLHVPSSGTNLRANVIQLAPKLLSLIISFVILGSYWVGHHLLLARVKKVGFSFTWRNILFLLPISIVPFSTSLLGAYPLSHTAQVVYAANLAICGIFLFSSIHYALVAPDMIEETPSLEFKRNVATKTLLPVAVYILAIGGTFLNPWVGMTLLILGPIITFAPIESKTWRFLVIPTDWTYNKLVARQKS